MTEQNILNQITAHWKAYAEYKLQEIKECLNRADGTTNVYIAKDLAEQLVEGLDIAGEQLLYPERFILNHTNECIFCKKKGEEGM